MCCLHPLLCEPIRVTTTGHWLQKVVMSSGYCHLTSFDIAYIKPGAFLYLQLQELLTQTYLACGSVYRYPGFSL